MKREFTHAEEVKGIVTSSGIWPWRKERSAEEIYEQNKLAAKQVLYVMKKHDATRLHYDFRFGYNGMLLSWVLPEGPSYYPGHEREAVRVADHSRENAFFEGCLEEGYGAGTVMLWDWGTCELLPGYTNVERAFRRGELKFILRGERLKGIWILRRITGYEGNRRNPHWVFIKERDAFARDEEALSILAEAPDSISTQRTMDGIQQDWRDGRRRNERQGTLFGD